MLAAILFVALTACPGRQTPIARPSGSQGSGLRGGMLNIALTQAVDAIDPQRAGAPASFALARAMHRGLMAFPPAGAPEGAEPVVAAGVAAPPDTSTGLPL